MIKIIPVIQNGLCGHMIYDKNNLPYTEANDFLEELSEKGYTSSTLKTFAIMLSSWIQYALMVGIDYLSIDKNNFEDILQRFIIFLGADGKRSQKRISKIIQVVLWFYRFHYAKIGDTDYLVYLDTLIDECKTSGIILRRGPTALDKNSKLRPENLDAMEKAANSLRDILLIRLVGELGLRPSELIRLRWADLNHAEKHICIAGPPAKTFILSGYRIVHLSIEIMELFNQYHEELINNGRLAEYIFVARVGPPTPIKYDTVMSLFRSLSVKIQQKSA